MSSQTDVLRAALIDAQKQLNIARRESEAASRRLDQAQRDVNFAREILLEAIDAERGA